MVGAPATTPIIVPVHLDALCVGQGDAHDRADQFASPLYDFLNLKVADTNNPVDQTPFINELLRVEPFGTANSKPAGVYLHWALPAALTHGSHTYQITPRVLNALSNQGFPAAILDRLQALIGQTFASLEEFKGGIETPIRNGLSGGARDGEVSWYQAWAQAAASQITFPALPDRWLVVRMQTPATSQPSHKAWLIESNFVTDTNLYDRTGSPYTTSAEIPWPFANGDSDDFGNLTPPYYRFLGRVRALDEQWPDGVPEYLPKLTAIGYGQPAFTGYLPHCQNVFGHYDALTGIKISGDVTLSYTVLGWFSSAEQDPFDGNPDPTAVAALLAQHKWTLPGYDPGWTAPDYDSGKKSEQTALLQSVSGSFYAGVLEGVQWNPAHAYVRAVALGADDVDVVVGRTGAEALAAYLAQNRDGAGPLSAEEKLEALQLGLLGRIQNSPEPEVLIEQALHTSGFRAENGGTVWQITRPSDIDPSRGAAQQFDEKMRSARQESLRLAPEIGDALNELNSYQRLFDTLQFHNEAQRRQLFFHWYYLLKWSYGSDRDADRASDLMQALAQLTGQYDDPLPPRLKKALEPSKALRKALGDLSELEVNGERIGDQALQNLPVFEQSLNDLSQQILARAIALDRELQSLGTGYRMQIGPAPRFWQPNEPHLLVVDKKGQFSSRFAAGSHTAPHLLLCRRADQTMVAVTPDRTPVQLSAGDDKGNQLTPGQVEIANRMLAEALCVLALGPGSLTPGAPGSAYSGFAPAAKAITSWGLPASDSGDGVSRDNPWHPILMQWQVKFHGFAREAGYAKTFITDRATLDQDHIDLTYAVTSDTQAPAAPTYYGAVVLSRRAASTLKDQAARFFRYSEDAELQGWIDAADDTPILSQALNGFNDALTTRLKEMQLAVHDPYATEAEDQDEMRRVQAAIGRYNDSAPMALDAYNPIQAGYLEVEEIRLVDVFGQYRTISSPSLIQPQRLKPQDGSNFMALPPRLVQPSRLLFRWLSADGDEAVEMNSHPATSPICGWVISNYLDDSLMIYAQDGTLLGAIGEGTRSNPVWIEAPGSAASPQPADIQNLQLREFVAGLLRHKVKKFRAFRQSIERVLLTIEPQGDPQQNSLAVLMGRPLALVQAMVALELKGPPVFRLNEQSYQAYADRRRLADDEFSKVRFPVRLGDLSRAADGLVGYFKADARGRINYNPSAFQAELAASNILLASYDRVKVAMLIDPRARVHATCGILPVKAIDIPADQYADSLRRMAFTFAVHPVLDRTDRLRLPLPAESDQAWIWLGKADEERWQTPNDRIGKATDRASYGQGGTLRLAEGWLQARPFAADKQRADNRSMMGSEEKTHEP